MKRKLLLFLCVLFNIIFVPIVAQEDMSNSNTQDTTDTQMAPMPFVDTLSAKEYKDLDKQTKLKLVEDFTPNPTKAVIYSAIFPGLGQIYNKKYWKLPIVYGGFLGVIYAVTWNGNMYADYKKGYYDFSRDPERYNQVWPSLIDEKTGLANRAQTRDRLKRQRDTFRRNRDLAIIVGVGLYALCMIDAYVDAQLYNFTISPDLSMTVAPVVWGPSQSSSSFALGIQCNIAF